MYDWRITPRVLDVSTFDVVMFRGKSHTGPYPPASFRTSITSTFATEKAAREQNSLTGTNLQLSHDKVYVFFRSQCSDDIMYMLILLHSIPRVRKMIWPAYPSIDLTLNPSVSPSCPNIIVNFYVFLYVHFSINQPSNQMQCQP